MTANRRSELADGLIAGLNRDPDQRAATQLLCTAAGSIWLSKLDGWPECLRDLDDDRHPDALWVDWHRLREDLAADDHAWSELLLVGIALALAPGGLLGRPPTP